MNGGSPSIPAMDDEIMSSRLIVHILGEEGAAFQSLQVGKRFRLSCGIHRRSSMPRFWTE